MWCCYRLSKLPTDVAELDAKAKTFSEQIVRACGGSRVIASARATIADVDIWDSLPNCPPTGHLPRSGICDVPHWA